MKPRYFGNWSDYGSMYLDFFNRAWNYETKKYDPGHETQGFPEDKEILLATYTYEDYSGSAQVFYRRDGKIYQIEGSHCSCNGLEESWTGHRPESFVNAQYIKQLAENDWMTMDPLAREAMFSLAKELVAES